MDPFATLSLVEGGPMPYIPPASDTRFHTDLDSVANLRQKMIDIPMWFREESERKVTLRQRKVELTMERDGIKRELKAMRDRCFSQAKQTAEKVTDKAAEAIADNDPLLLPVIQRLSIADGELDYIQIQYEQAVDIMDSLRLLHRSLTVLMGDLMQERFHS